MSIFTDSNDKKRVHARHKGLHWLLRLCEREEMMVVEQLCQACMVCEAKEHSKKNKDVTKASKLTNFSSIKNWKIYRKAAKMIN